MTRTEPSNPQQTDAPSAGRVKLSSSFSQEPNDLDTLSFLFSIYWSLHLIRRDLLQRYDGEFTNYDAIGDMHGRRGPGAYNEGDHTYATTQNCRVSFMETETDEFMTSGIRIASAAERWREGCVREGYP